MGQFEYSVPLSRVKPEDIERIAKEYLAKKETMSIKPFEDKVLVKPIIESETRTSSGLVLQRNDSEKPSEGIVEAVGPGLVFPNGTKLEIDLKPGDKVFYSKFAGVEYEDYVLLPYKDILAVIED